MEHSKSKRSIESTIGAVAAIFAIGSLILHFYDETATGKGTMIKLFLIVIMAWIALAVASFTRGARQ